MDYFLIERKKPFGLPNTFSKESGYTLTLRDNEVSYFQCKSS